MKCVEGGVVLREPRLQRRAQTLASSQRMFLSNATMSFGQKEPPQPTPSFCSSIGVIWKTSMPMATMSKSVSRAVSNSLSLSISS